MFDIQTFAAPIVEAIVNDPQSETGKRDARYIPATCIPEDIIKKMFGYGVENKRHPHNIRGMAWDLTVNGWRNMKNAEVLNNGPEQEVVWDMADSRTFIA